MTSGPQTSGPNDKTAQGKKRTTEKRPKGQVVLHFNIRTNYKDFKNLFVRMSMSHIYSTVFGNGPHPCTIIYMYDAVIPILWRLG